MEIYIVGMVINYAWQWLLMRITKVDRRNL